jgi:hypothetical protein
LHTAALANESMFIPVLINSINYNHLEAAAALKRSKKEK